MVTNATDPEVDEGPSFVETTVRSAIAGHPQGAVRRIVLYVVAGVLVLTPVPAAAIIPILLLALTDQLA